MLRFLHTLSAILFYFLGSVTFLAYVLEINAVMEPLSLLWLSIVDLPLLCVGLLYAGLSLYHSLAPKDGSRSLAVGIGLPLTMCFLVITSLKFFIHHS